jgi:hypothetical protein
LLTPPTHLASLESVAKFSQASRHSQDPEFNSS